MKKRKAKKTTNRPVKQPMSQMTYAVFSMVFLIIAIGLLVFYVFKAKDLVNLGIEQNVYYILLLAMGAFPALLFFGAMRSYARYKGKQFSGKLMLGGPVVLFLLVVGGYLLIPRSGPFDFTVILRDAEGKAALKGTGTVRMLLGGEVREERIDDKGAVDFKNIPHSYRNGEVNLELEVEGWRFEKGKAAVTCALEGNNARLTIERARVFIAGSVVDGEGAFIPGVKVTVNGLSPGLTDENGRFSLETTQGDHGERVRVTFEKERFVTGSLDVEPGNAGDLKVSLERRETEE